MRQARNLWKAHIEGLHEQLERVDVNRGAWETYILQQPTGYWLLGCVAAIEEPQTICPASNTFSQAFVLRPPWLTHWMTLSSVVKHSSWPAISTMTSKRDGSIQFSNKESRKVLSSLYIKSMEVWLMLVCPRT